jgi:hypothetical protein
MHSVPNSLLGASLGDAHKWVRSQMVLSNPHKPMADYILTNENGATISLSDLTKGKASHVTINAAGSVRSNPAAPSELAGFMEIPKPMHSSRLTALTQDDITPALYDAMVNQYGLFSAIQTLSILLTRPVSPSLHHSQKTINLIRARRGDSLMPLHQYLPSPQKKQERQRDENKRKDNRNTRRNPAAADVVTAADSLNLAPGSVVLSAQQLNRAGGLGLNLDRTTNDIRREIDKMLDDAEDAFEQNEHGALISVANKMSLKYENSAEIFDNFARQVLAPYLITSTANVNALKYINEYILPAMRAVIEDKRGSSDKQLRKLDRQYKHIVSKLATDPRDFYMGSEFALIAHPGFLFPRAGLALMPVPTSTRDMAFRAFEQAGTPPTYDPVTGFVATIAPSDRAGVAYIGRETIQRMGRRTFGQGRNMLNVNRVIDSLIDVIERFGETDSSGFNVLVRDTRTMASIAANAGDQLYRRIAGMPVFYFADLPGIRPIPTNWPQGLILAMMEVLAQNRDRITGLGGGAFNAAEFMTPSGINLATGGSFGTYDNYAAWTTERTRLAGLAAADLAAGGVENENALRLLGSLIDVARQSGIMLRQPIGGNPQGPFGNIPNDIVDIRAEYPGGDLSTDEQRSQLKYRNSIAGGIPVADGGRIIGAYTTLAEYLQNIVNANLGTGVNRPVSVGNHPLPGYAIDIARVIAQLDPAGPYMTAISTQFVNAQPLTAQNTSDSPSVYQIMLEAVELSMRKYKYNPSKDDIYFTVVLLYYSLRNMGLDAEVTGFLSRVSNILQQARRRALNDFLGDVVAAFPAPMMGGAPIAPAAMNNYLALKFAYDAFNDPTSDAFRALTGVRVNPAPAADLVGEAQIKNIRESLKASIDMYENALKRTGQDSNAEAVVDALRELVMPQILKQMNENPHAYFTYVGATDTPTEKIIETVDTLYGQCDTAISEHIDSLGNLANVLQGTLPGDLSDNLLTALTEIQESSEKLDLLDKTATALDDFMKFLPKSVTKIERAYVTAMKSFMTIIADDIQFDSETTSNMIKEVKQHKDDLNAGNKIAYPVISTLIDELKEMQDVVRAYDESLDAYDSYNAASTNAGERYPNAPTADRRSVPVWSHRQRDLIKAYTSLLPMVSSYCNSTLTTDYIKREVASKADIPIRIASTGLNEPNPFDSFIRGRQSTPSAQAFYFGEDLRITGRQRRAYLALFESGDNKGRLLLDILSEIADDVGFVQQRDFLSALDRRIRNEVDSVYAKYKTRTKMGKGTKLLAADTIALAKGTGNLLQFGGRSLVAGTGAILGAGGQAIVEGTKAGIGSVKGIGAAVGGAVAGTGAMLGGLFIGTGLALGSALISGGITAAGLAGSLGISAIVSTAAYFQSRRDLKRAIMQDPDFIQGKIDILTAKQQERLSKMQVAQDERERRALQLQADMAYLGAQRLRFAAKAAEAEQRLQEAEAAAAEAELDRIEFEIAQKAEEMKEARLLREENLATERMEAEDRIERAKLERKAEQVERAADYDKLNVDLAMAKRQRQNFVSSIGGRNKAESDNRRMTGEMAQVYSSETPAQYLQRLDQDILTIETKLKRLQGVV